MSGTRVVPKGKQQVVAGLPFSGYGSHCDAYGHVYVTAAAAVGGSAAEADAFGERLSKCLQEAAAKQAKQADRAAAQEQAQQQREGQ